MELEAGGLGGEDVLEL